MWGKGHWTGGGGSAGRGGTANLGDKLARSGVDTVTKLSHQARRTQSQQTSSETWTVVVSNDACQDPNQPVTDEGTVSPPLSWVTKRSHVTHSRSHKPQSYSHTRKDTQRSPTPANQCLRTTTLPDWDKTMLVVEMTSTMH
jgi:hypothetical protein